MARPQTAIFDERSSSHQILEYRLATGVGTDALRAALAAALANNPAAGDTGLVVAFGAELWRRLAPQRTPTGLRSFETLPGWQGHHAPATQRDLFFWVHGERRDLVFERALGVHRAVAETARLELELSGFVYRDSRDLTGFIDGTANPKQDERFEAALVPEGQPGAGGSFVLSQQWIHDLVGWNALPVAAQERVIGRTKADSVELEGAAKAADSHVARVEVEEDGVELALYRRSIPYGGVGEHGLYFLAFSCDLHRYDVLLRRMFGLSGDGLHDALTAHSRPLSGSYWFAPGEGDLASVLAR